MSVEIKRTRTRLYTNCPAGIADKTLTIGQPATRLKFDPQGRRANGTFTVAGTVLFLRLRILPTS